MALTRVKFNDNVTIDGNVGIGESNPGHKLHINGGSNDEARVRVSNTASGQASLDLNNSEGYFRTYTDAGEYRIYDQTDGIHRLVIDTSGHVTTPNQPYFAAVCAGTSAYTSFGQAVALPFNSTAKNIGGHFSTSNYRFTAPVTGKYAFSAGVITNDANPVGRMMFFINGSQDYLGIKFGISGSNTAGGGSTTTSAIIHLLANDYVDIRSQSGTMIAYTGGGHSSFTGTLIS